MKVGGGLNYVTGPMGAGKTLNGVRRIVEAVTTGRYVITNIELRPGWERIVAAHVCRTGTPAKRRRVAAQLAGYYVHETDLHVAMSYRLPGEGEARGIFVWDEGQNDLNNRNWRDDGRDAILRWATQLRKLGFVGYLLSQHADNTDAALRRVCNFVIRLQNQREQVRTFGLRITPWPLFLASWYPAHLATVGVRVPAVKTERYFLSWHRRLYDTMGLFHGLAGEDDDGVVLLPAGGLPAAAPAHPGEAGEPAGRRPLDGPESLPDGLPALAVVPAPSGPVGSLDEPMLTPETARDPAGNRASQSRDEMEPRARSDSG